MSAEPNGGRGLRCLLGLHDRRVYDMHVALHMGFFGGPVTTYYWECRRCRKRGTT